MKAAFLLPLILFQAGLFAASAGAQPPDEAWLFERYQAGDLDTILALLGELPDSSAAGKFFRGVFETDGFAARFYYDQVLALFPLSPAEGWALGKLWQYHYAKGENEQARRYYQFLQERHPGHPCLKPAPDFGVSSTPARSAAATPPPPKKDAAGPKFWAVQVGAFAKKSGAETTAKRVKKYGEVSQMLRTSAGQKLTVVTVGKFKSEDEARRLAEQINQETGIAGRVVALDKP